MNRVHTFFAILTICAGLVGWQILQQNGDQAPAADGGTRLVDFEDAATPEVPATTAGPEAVTPAQETELVMGFRVLKNRNCDVEVHYIPDPESGEMHEAMACIPRNPKAPHPYQSWSEEVLAGLAYGDAKAAEILGLRHIHSADPAQEQLGLSLLYRAVALSGDPSAFRQAVGIRYAHVSINGEAQIKNLKQLMVFNVMGEALGDERFDSSIVEQELRSADTPDEEILRLRTASRDLLSDMADLQTEITGSTSIREALENA